MKISLTPIDYYFYRRHPFTIKYVFEYQGRIDFSQFSENLKKATELFPLASSRMKLVSNQEISLETGFPIPLTKEVLDIEVGISAPEEIDKFLKPLKNASEEPMLTFHLTYTPTRTFVGFSMNHTLGDATSRSLFLSGLSAICLGRPILDQASHRRDLLQLGNGIFKKPKENLFATTGYTIPRATTAPGGPLETIRYTNTELAELKSDFKNRGVPASTNDIVMAKLAKQFHADIPLFEGKFIVRCPVNYRKMLDLPAGYFGNAILDAIAIFDQGEVEKLSVQEVAVRIRKAIAEVTVEKVRQSLQCLNALRETEGFNIFEDVGRPGLIVTNITTLPINTYDFGIGAPQNSYMMSLTPGVGIIIPSEDGIEVRFRRPNAK